MQKGTKHTVESRLRQSLAARERHAKGEKRRRLEDAERRLRAVASRHKEGELDTD